MGTKINDNVFEYDNMKYFRKNAFRIEVASFGEKKNDGLNAGHLEVHGSVYRSIVSGYAKKGLPIGINFKNYSKKDVDITGTIPVYGVEGKFNYSYGDLTNEDLQLLPLLIDQNPLIKMLNTEANAARNSMKDEGGDARIVSLVWIVVKWDLSEAISSATTVDLSAFNGLLKLELKGGRKSGISFSVAEGSTFAYSLCKVTNWDKQGDKHIVNKMDEDEPI